MEPVAREPVTEARNPRSMELDTLSALEIVTLMNDEDARVAAAVRAQLPQVARAVELMAGRLRAGARVFYVGAGTSGRIGALDAAEWGPTFGVDEDLVQVILAGGPAALLEPSEAAEDDEPGGAEAVRAKVRPGDVVVGLSASGSTPFVLGALREARRLGAATVAVACNRPADVEAYADVAILPVVGPEVLTGSTRLKAGTAQKMVLNMLSTAAMVQLGKVYQNLMVDLRPANRKLVERAVRAITQATGVGEAQAREAFAACGGEVKTAIVMILAGVQPPEARRRLARSGGFVRGALATGPQDRGPSPDAGGEGQG